MVWDAINPASPEATNEKIISDAVQAAYTANVQIQCITQGEFDFRLWPPYQKENVGQKSGYAVPVTPIVWLDKNVCKAVTNFAQSEQKSLVDGDQIYALGAVAHELSHKLFYTLNESITRCEAIQIVDSLASALGADEKVALEVRTRLGEMTLANKADTISTEPIQLSVPKEYALQDCYDGGPHDLHPETPGVFPQTK